MQQHSKAINHHTFHGYIQRIHSMITFSELILNINKILNLCKNYNNLKDSFAGHTAAGESTGDGSICLLIPQLSINRDSTNRTLIIPRFEPPINFMLMEYMKTR